VNTVLKFSNLPFIAFASLFQEKKSKKKKKKKKNKQMQEQQPVQKRIDSIKVLSFFPET
jgi:hypothetical protein